MAPAAAPYHGDGRSAATWSRGECPRRRGVASTPCSRSPVASSSRSPSRPSSDCIIAAVPDATSSALGRFDRTIALRDGTVVRLRPIRADDAPRLIALLRPAQAALVVESPTDADTLIAVARYEPAGEPGAVEVAFVVQDPWQGRGLGTGLFRELLSLAELNGVQRFRAWVLADNRRMLDLVTRLGDVRGRTFEQGVVELTFLARVASA
ncbi:MAG: GNAT family N-acetyltransferase [Candidatus Rokuibacteriota bacterium]|nr:MAG: GNAT family N-acetyltransferase [Candidatus Rokubacteria bacterium]